MFKLQIGCFIIVLFISLIYFSTKRLKTYPHILFSASLMTTAVNLLFDIITVYTVNHLDTVPKWLNRACHDIFLISLFLEVFIYYLYCVSLINDEPPTNKKVAVLSVPLIISVICVIALPLGYVEDPKSNYSYGPSVIILYIFVIAFVVTALMKILIHFREINPKKRYVIITAMAIQFVCLIIQSIFKNLLITSEGLTLINLACFLTVEGPDVLLLEQLEEEKERANKANAAKSTFLAQMSHEIRTPINAMLGMNEMILRETNEENIREYAGNAYNAGNALLSIINDILDVSKIEAGKMEIVETEYYLSSLVNDCYLMSAERAKKKALDFTVECDEKLPSKFRGDMFHIRQIAVNFLTNAVKYTDEGSVKLTFSGEKKEDVFLLHISVKDTGIGLTEESRNKLFTNFQRFELEKNHFVEGTGLGLSICKRLTELMGGTIDVKSGYGKGSEFICTIQQDVVDSTPIGKIQPERSSVRISTDNEIVFTASRAEVLVVDDVEMNLIVFQNLLKRNLLSIDTAQSGKKALEKVRDRKYDIIFMDHMMPEMDGMETYEHMKNMEHLNKDTPVIMLTANAISGEKEKYMNAGFAAYLTKPIDSKKLNEVLIEYLPKEKIVWKEWDNTNAGGKVLDIADTDLINVNMGLSYSGHDETAYFTILKSYVKNGADNPGKIIGLVDAENWNDYTIAAHALKSTSLTIGAEKLSKMAEEMELAGKSGDYELIKSKNDKLIETYKKVLEDGKKVLSFSDISAGADSGEDETSKEKETENTNVYEASAVKLVEIRERIKSAMAAFDDEEIAAVFDEMAQYSINGTLLSERFSPVKELSDDFEYKDAQTMAERIFNEIL